MATELAKESRVGKQPVPVPAGVTVSINGPTVTVKGKLGELTRTFNESVEVVQEGSNLIVKVKPGFGLKALPFQGLTRALLGSAVQGVAEGYKISLDLVGVGYRAEQKGDTLDLSLGLSHHVLFPVPKGVKVTIETIDQAGTKRPRLHLESHDKELLGQTAARIRSFRPPEPYKGKGVRYTNERVRQKAGKAGSA